MNQLEDRVESAPSAADLLGGNTARVLDCALQRDAGGQPDASVRALVVSLARASGALDLRLARLVCHLQQMDLRQLGYGSFSSFVRGWPACCAATWT